MTDVSGFSFIGFRFFISFRSYYNIVWRRTGPLCGPFLYMKERKKGSVKRWLIIVVTVIGMSLLAVILGFVGFVGYVATTTDVKADMSLMESMRVSRTTRLFSPSKNHLRENLTLETYTPNETDILYGDENMVWAESEEIPDRLKQAFISIEDSGFYDHHGVEWGRTMYAALNQVLHFRPRFGGSTITQQLIKNVHGEKDVSVSRKVREIVRARRVEKEYTKDEILTYYLNIVPLGNNCVGVKSAARYYFNCELSELGDTECAALAAITNAPAKYDPRTHAENNTRRRTLVLDAMHREGYLSEAEYNAAKSKQLVLDITDPVYTAHTHNWYVDTVVSDVIADLMTQYDMSEGAATALLYRGGLEIYTLMDPEIQEILETYFADETHFTDIDGSILQAGMTIIDPASGDLLGVVGGVGNKNASRLFNRATEGYYPPGSALKPPALYGPGIEWDVIHYATVFEDAPMGEEGNFWPHNSPNLYAGRIGAHEALAKSKNTVAVQLLQQLGQERVYRHLKETLGMTGLVRDGKVSDLAVAPLALGQLSYGTNVRELSGIYASFASGGILSKNRSYLAVFDANGKPLLKNDNHQKRVWSEQTAYLLTRMMSEVVETGTGRRIALKGTVDTAGKTGTSGADRDKWFVGYTPYYVGGIHCSFDDRTPVAAASKIHLGAWDAVMKKIHDKRLAADEEVKHFEMPEGIVVAEFCCDSGLIPTEACRYELRGDRTRVGYFKADHVPVEACHSHVTGHYSIMNDTYGFGISDGFDAIDFYALSVPERKQYGEIVLQDDPFTLEYLIRENKKKLEEVPLDESSTLTGGG